MRLTRWLVVLAAGMLTLGVSAGSAHAARPTAHTYYVSPRGNDANDGLSRGAPFLHIQKCAEVAVAGDTCSVMGGTYHETVKPANSGTARAPITYSTYAGQTVIVDGADPVSGWQPVTSTDLAALTANDAKLASSPFARAVRNGQVYEAPLAIASGLAGNQVFVDRTAANEAQWPDPGSDAATPKVEYAATGTAGTKIVDPALTQPDGYWVGSSIYTRRWYDAQTQAVASSSTGSVTMTQQPNLGVAPYQAGYYLYGSLEAFSATGQWFYDSARQRLYLWSTTAPGTRVEAKQRMNAFDLTDASYTRVEGFHVHGASLTTGSSTTGDVFSGMKVQYVSAFDSAPTYIAGNGDSGIDLDGTANTLEDSQIAYSAGNDVFLTGSGNTVTNNVIHDASTMGTDTGAVTVLGNHQTVTHNTMFRLGHGGINVDWHLMPAGQPYVSQYNTFSYNDISAFGRLTVDTGAIYVCCTVDMTGTTIDHNWVHDATVMPLVDQYAESGVYLDNNSGYGSTVWDNVGWDNGYLYGAAVLLNSHGAGAKVYNNDGVVTYYNGPYDPGTQIVNNIGADQAAQSSGGVTISNNLPSMTDPLYVDPTTRDFQLQATSPARLAGTPISGVTDGSTDPAPSIGAYQYGAAPWRPGASIAASPYVEAASTTGGGYPGSYTVPVGSTVSVPLTALYSNGITASVRHAEYTAVDPSIASVDPNGRVHGLKAGATTVIARVTSHGLAAVTQFIVTVLPTRNTVPAGWSVQNLGTDEDGSATNGFASYDGTNYALWTTGSNIYSTVDRGTFLYRPTPVTSISTLTVTATVNSKTDSAGSGPMIRDSGSASAKQVNLQIQAAGNQIVLEYRALTGGGSAPVTESVPITGVTPQQLKLVKSGDTFTGYYYTDGAWVEVGSVSVVMDTSLEAGASVYVGRYGGGFATMSGLSAVTS